MTCRHAMAIGSLCEHNNSAKGGLKGPMGSGEGKAAKGGYSSCKCFEGPSLPFPSLGFLCLAAFKPCESQRWVRANGGAPAQQEPNPLRLHAWGSSSSREPPCPSCLPVVRHRHHHHHHQRHHSPHRFFLQTNLPTMRGGH